MKSSAALVVAGLLVAAGCGDDTTDATDLDRYCDLMSAYADSTELDVSSVQSTLDGLAAAADAATAVADVAPDAVAEEHERIAASAQELVSRLLAAAPQTMEEITTIGNQITAALESEQGDLDAETQAVSDFAEEECGIVVESP